MKTPVSHKPTIIIADDDYDFSQSLAKFFQNNGYQVATLNEFSTSKSIKKNIDTIHRLKPNFILMDFHLNTITAKNFLAELDQKPGTTHSKRIIMSTSQTVASTAEACNAYFLEKPFQFSELECVIREMTKHELFRQYRMSRKNKNIFKDVYSLFVDDLN